MGDKNIVKCRTCNGDHWTSKCPGKGTVLSGGEVPDSVKRVAAAPSTSAWKDTVEVRENGLRIVTEYKYNNHEKKVKVVRTFKTEKRFVPKSIALRKTWAKFGDSADDKPGPNPATTTVGEDVYMQFITSKEEDNKMDEEGGINNLKALGDKNIVKCRTCSGDHWTSKCPWKDTVLSGGKVPDEVKKAADEVKKAADEIKKAADEPSTYSLMKIDEDILKTLGGKNKFKCSARSREHWSSKSPWKNTVLFGGKISGEFPEALGGKTIVKCRTCSGEHSASKCPWKNSGFFGGRIPSTKSRNFEKCRICSGEHWASKCPRLSGAKIPDSDKRAAAVLSTSAKACKSASTKYLPYSIRGDGNDKYTEYSMPGASGKDDTTTIRIANLSDSTTESDLEDLLKPFGPIQKLYLARDEQQGLGKRFAYVNFKFRNDAAKTIATMNGYGYDYLILSVEWSKFPAPLTSTVACKPASTKYLRGDGNVKRSMKYSLPGARGREDTTAIRISNLSDSTTKSHLEDLVKPFGPIQKLYLARDKQQAVCKGFAYVHFKFRNDAAKAIATLNGYGYDHLILSVDWSKPPARSTQ